MARTTPTNEAGASWPPYGLGSTRLLVLGWCLWLLGAWGVVLWTDSPVPATRWMVFASLFGLMAIWPAWRLSQGPAEGEAEAPAAVWGQTLMDWSCLILVWQAVVWPLRLTAGWSLAQTWWLDVAVASWSGLAGLFIAWGRSRIASRDARAASAARTIAMALCVGVLLAEPAAMLLSGGRWPMRVSPIEAVWALSAPATRARYEGWTSQVAAVAVAAALGWLAWGVWLAVNRRSQATH